MKKWKWLCWIIYFYINLTQANAANNTSNDRKIFLLNRSSFFRLSYDHLKMPENFHDMGLLGLNYFAYLTPNIYAGIGAYGAITGNQGGLFTFGFAAGLQNEVAKRWFLDLGLFIGGGGGSSTLVGQGLMLRPHFGLAYHFKSLRLGVQYSYINFPLQSKIHSQQIGLNLDIPFDFYYLCPSDLQSCSNSDVNPIFLLDGKTLDFGRNDFGIILQAYQPKHHTLDVNKEVRNETIFLIGAELDHYFSDFAFWWLKASGAFKGIPHGYMDVLGGMGYHFPFTHQLSLIPKLGVGAGGGGSLDTGSGLIIQPEIGVEWSFTPRFAVRLSGGYLQSFNGGFKAITGTGEVLYHLNLATGSECPTSVDFDSIAIQEWKIIFFNQIYMSPQRNYTPNTAPDYLLGIQFDQYFSPFFFFSYQAASAYAGTHAGGLASGMIGPGIQSPHFLNPQLSLFAELLVGAGGGGALKLGNGAIFEPVIGLNYDINPGIGLQASFSQIKAFSGGLSTPVINLGVSIRFGTLTNTNM